MLHQRVSSLYAGLASGGRNAKTVLRLDSDTPAATTVALPTASVVATVGTAVSDDTLVMGNVTLTWKASPSGENQVDIGASAGVSATNLGAAINAHSKLGGVVSAVVAGAAVTISWVGAGRESALVSLSETGSSVTIDATTFAPANTLAKQTSPQLFRQGL